MNYGDDFGHPHFFRNSCASCYIYLEVDSGYVVICELSGRINSGGATRRYKIFRFARGRDGSSDYPNMACHPGTGAA